MQTKGKFIDINTLDQNEKRINSMMGTFNFLKTDVTKKNTQPKKIAGTHCLPKYSCSNEDLRDKRKKITYIRQPVLATRKQLQLNENDNNLCKTTTKLYKDNYSQCSNNGSLGVGCMMNGSLPTGRTYNINLLNNVVKSKSGITTRTAKPLIRSGMQPNTAGQQNSGLNLVSSGKKRSTYSYSYRELLNNRRKDTYTKKLQHRIKEDSKDRSAGGNCNSCNTTVSKFSNDGFKIQGAVDSSSRLDRLKLDTIRSGKKCSDGTCESNRLYFAGKPKFTMGPKQTNIGCTTQRKYKGLFNQNHSEVNYPQTRALARVRGATSKNKTSIPNGGVCCVTKEPEPEPEPDIYEIGNRGFRLRNFQPSNATILSEISDMKREDYFLPLPNDFTIDSLSSDEKNLIKFHMIKNTNDDNSYDLVLYRSASYISYYLTESTENPSFTFYNEENRLLENSSLIDENTNESDLSANIYVLYNTSPTPEPEP